MEIAGEERMEKGGEGSLCVCGGRARVHACICGVLVRMCAQHGMSVVERVFSVQHSPVSFTWSSSGCSRSLMPAPQYFNCPLPICCVLVVFFAISGCRLRIMISDMCPALYFWTQEAELWQKLLRHTAEGTSLRVSITCWKV